MAIQIKILSQSITEDQNVVTFILSSNEKTIFSGGLNFSRKATVSEIKNSLALLAKTYSEDLGQSQEQIPNTDMNIDIPYDQWLPPPSFEQLTKEQMNKYGTVLTGQETALQLIQLERIKTLKDEMRLLLAGKIGDNGDNIADTTRALVLGEAIRIGLVADKVITDAYGVYVESLLTGYGGAKAILDVLQLDLQFLGQYLVGKYYPAKARVESATTAEEVEGVTL